MMGSTTGPPPRRLKHYTLGGTLLMALLLGLGIWRANPPFPATPELDGVSLKLSQPPAAPPSAALTKLLRSSSSPIDPRSDKVLRRTSDVVHDGDWLEDLDKVEAALRSADLAGLRAGLRAPGCLPAEKPSLGALMKNNYLHLHRAVKLLVLNSVVRTQRGAPGEAARELGWLAERLVLLERRCHTHILGVTVVTASIDELLAGIKYPIGHPALSDGERAKLFALLRTLEARPNPMPAAYRAEARWMLHMHDKLLGEERTPWPWFDAEETKRYVELVARRGVWMAELPLDSDKWTRPCPEHEYFERIGRDSRWLSMLRYNGTGKVLLSLSLPAIYRNRTQRWHLSACKASARRALWAQQVRQRGLAVPAAATTPPPRDRFSGKPFGSITPRDEVCVLTRRHGSERPGGPTTPSLPPARGGEPGDE